MSEDNVEVVRQVVQAFNRRDLAAMTERFDPDIEWTPGGPAAVERGLYRGREEVSDGFADTWEAWEVFVLEEHEVRDLDQTILWLGRTRLRGGASHVELDEEFAILFDLRGGSIVLMRGLRRVAAGPRSRRAGGAAMSEENVEVVRRVFDAFNSRDWAAWESHHHPDFEWSDPPGFPGGGIHRGVESVQRFLDEVLETAEEWRVEIDHIESVGEGRVLMRGRSVLVGRVSHIAMEDPLFQLFDLEHSRIRRVHTFRSSDEALEAAGLEE